MNEDTMRYMLRYGGSFAKKLADTWRVADPENRTKLEAALPDVFGKYDRWRRADEADKAKAKASNP